MSKQWIIKQAWLVFQDVQYIASVVRKLTCRCRHGSEVRIADWVKSAEEQNYRMSNAISHLRVVSPSNSRSKQVGELTAYISIINISLLFFSDTFTPCLKGVPVFSITY